MSKISLILLILIESSRRLGANSISPYAIDNRGSAESQISQRDPSASDHQVGVPMALKSDTNNIDLDVSLFMGKKEYEEYMEFIKNNGYNFSYDDINNESRTILFTQILPSIIIYSLTFLVGFFGNLLVLVAIFRVKKLQSPTNLFLFSLATADLILICACVPIKIVEFLSNEWIFGRFMCKIFHYIQNLITICSVMNLTGMSLERYIAILHPLKAKYMCTKKRIKVVACCIWVFSFVAALPILYGKEAQLIGNVRQVYICKRVWNNDPNIWRIFEVYRSCLILFAPLIIIIYTYTQICIQLWRATNDRKALTGQTRKFSAASKSNCNRSSKDSANFTAIEKCEETQRLSDNDIDSKNSSFKKESFSNRKSIQLDERTVTPSIVPDAETNGLRPNSGAKMSLTFFRNKSATSLTDENRRMIYSSRNKSDDLQKRKQIVKMLVVIVCIFFISWAPITINNLLVSFGQLPNVNGGVLWYLRMIFYLMSYVNSCLNPIVYGLMSTNFRDAYKKIFSKKI